MPGVREEGKRAADVRTDELDHHEDRDEGERDRQRANVGVARGMTVVVTVAHSKPQPAENPMFGTAENVGTGSGAPNQGCGME